MSGYVCALCGKADNQPRPIACDRADCPGAQRLGDAPIVARHRDAMRTVADALEEIFNGAKDPESGKRARENGFVLMVFPFDLEASQEFAEKRCNYISNVKRADVIVMLKEQLARFEGMAESPGGQA